MDYILTDNGAVLMTQVAAGRTLIFTRTESGSGYSASPAVLRNVIDKKQDMFLDEVKYENKKAVVKAVLTNMQLEEEYPLRQIGIYAKIEGEETDTLVIIGQQYNGEKIPPYGEGIINIEYEIHIKIAGTGNVEIEGVGTGYVTKEQFLTHLSDDNNPHKVTAGQVGLEKVPNVGTNDQVPEFVEAEERENIKSGETLAVLFGKIRKWLADLREAAYCSVANNLVTMLPGSVLDARQGKALQDQISQLYSDIGGFAPVIDETGKITGYTTTIGGADTVFPFSGEIDKALLINALQYSSLNLTLQSTPEQIYAALAAKFPYQKLVLINYGTVHNDFTGLSDTTQGSVASHSSSYNSNGLNIYTLIHYEYYGAGYHIVGISKGIENVYKKLTFSVSSYSTTATSASEKKSIQIGVASSPIGTAFIKSVTVTGANIYTIDISSITGVIYFKYVATRAGWAHTLIINHIEFET